MRVSKTLLLMLVLCYAWPSCIATVLNLLQFGAGTTATYGVTLNPIGTAITAAVGIGALAAIAGARRRRGRRWRFGRSAGSPPDAEDPVTGEEPLAAEDFALLIIEVLDGKGCARKLLCAQAAYEKAVSTGETYEEPQYEDDDTYKDLQFEADPSDDRQYKGSDPYLDMIGREILEFIRGEDGTDTPLPGTARARLFSVIELGESGGDCGTTFHQCPYNRTQILEFIHREGVF